MKIRLFAILCLIVATIGSVYSNDRQLQTPQNGVNEKIAPWVLEHTRDGKAVEFLVVLSEQADLSGAAVLKTKKEKGRFVYNALWNKARDSQRSLLKWLEFNGIEHRSYYIVNMVWVKAGLNAALDLAARSEVNRIEANPTIHIDPIMEPTSQSTAEPQAIEGNITNTRAPEVWALGYTGQGVVVGGADTGYRWDHVTIKPHYRGFDGVNANHDFNWHDSVHSGGGVCGANSQAPCDDNGHGTHTMGTVLGDDGAGNQIGMAPGAKWVACRNMNQGDGTPATYIECMEFFLAPYPVNGTPAQGDPDKAPDITSNSWSCPPSEGCAAGTLKQAVEAQRAAGIMMVVAAGNDGPSCSSVVDPPGIYDANYSIGAFDHRTNTIAGFSSRGPVTVDGSNRIKPDISAPGVGIRSAWRTSTTTFTSISGTSMATPHVAGAVALLWSAQPALIGNVAFTEQILDSAAVDVSSTSCSSNGVPNNVYGHGRLDIKAAVDAALPCTSVPTLSESNKSINNAGGVGTVNVVSVGGCGWIATTDVNWIDITSGSSGVGNGTVSYSVDPNSSATQRSGTLIIGGQTYTVNQSGVPTIGLGVFATDLDQDGEPEIGFYRSGLWGFLKSAQSYSLGSAQFFSWGGLGLQPICADFDGDTKADLAYIVPASGGQSATYAILQSSTGYSFAAGDVLFVPAGFPALGDTPIVGDFDGDGKADPGIWRTSEGIWIIPKSSSGYSSFIFSQWGQPGDQPVVADFDMDGKADIGFYRDGLWGVLKSAQNYSLASAQFFSWGGAGLQPIVGDFDGDTKADIAYIVPPANGQSAVYSILKSSTNYDFNQALFVPAGFPILGDTPVVGDFDGDGKDDPGIWRESQGLWIVPRSMSNYTTFLFSQWGQPADIVFPNSTGKR